jgi:hypothetical protein
LLFTPALPVTPVLCSWLPGLVVDHEPIDPVAPAEPVRWTVELSVVVFVTDAESEPVPITAVLSDDPEKVVVRVLEHAAITAANASHVKLVLFIVLL